MNIQITQPTLRYYWREVSSPKYIVCAILFLYNFLGITVLGFNRSFSQVAITAIAAIILQLFFDKIFYNKISNPLSALTTSFGLSILLNYGHNNYLPLVSIYLAIASKFFFTFKNKHTFNPGLLGVVLSLLITHELISPAPAYQWNGMASMSTLIAIPALILFMPRINRHYIVLSFLITFTLQLILRSILIKHYLPFNTLFFGTITSPPFFLFVFFMITDPATSPNDKKGQIITGIWLALLDLFFHLFQSYHTFFYAALVFGSYKLLSKHFQEFKKVGLSYPKITFITSGYYKRFLTIILIAVAGYCSYHFLLQDYSSPYKAEFNLEEVSNQSNNMNFDQGEIFDVVDPRVKHMAKWILAISDGVAISDADNDGLIDLFFTNGHKAKSQRNIFYKNLGDFKFQKINFPDLDKYSSDYKKYGVPSNAMFVDFDNDGDKDLFITYAFGSEGQSRLFLNELKENGILNFKDVSRDFNLTKFTNSATANFLDINKDGKLDLIIGNTIATHLPDYANPTKLDLFSLPKEEYPGDERMYNFMHDSWHMAKNGAANFIYLNTGKKFVEFDIKKNGIFDTRWTMAIGTADFNLDGWTDIYFANDFGPDNLYLNQEGKSFQNIKGQYFGEIGKDTYKGMNATIADFDNNGQMDVYISNVHHALQAEGSLLWTFHNQENSFVPKIKDQASYLGVLNENRFGWGASAADLNNDGEIDLLQANGMVDDKFDRLYDSCPDYWYINEKIARSPPSIHRYINKWGDARGTCIHGKEKNRLYINRGVRKRPQFIDIADQVGMDQVGNYRGVATGDFNNDGQIDVVISSLYRDPLVFKNISKKKSKHNWIGLELLSNNTRCNKMGIGSRITVKYFDKDNKLRTQVKETTLVNGFSAQNDTRVHFGFGQNIKLKEIEINWCLQFKKYYSKLKLNSYQKIIL